MQAAIGTKKKASPARQFVAGSIAGVVASTVLTPLEVVKTRLQSSHSSRLRLDKLLMNVVRTEGVAGLFRGVAMNVVGVGPARAVHFGAYNMFKTFGAERLGIHGVPQHMLAGALASMTAASVTSPIWVIKTRMQLQTTPIGSRRAGIELTATEKAYSGPISAAKTILRDEGFRGLFRGLSASYLGVGEAAIQFALYEFLRKWYMDTKHLDADGFSRGGAMPPMASFVIGASAKLVAASITYPHEVLRTRMREIPPAGSGGRPEFSGIVATTQRILQREGIRGLYGGMFAHMVRTVPNAAILLLVVEAVSGRGL